MDIDIDIEGMPDGRIPASSHRKKAHIVIVSDSLLKATETTLCGPDRVSWKVCCISGAKIKDVTESFPRIIKFTDLHPFHLILVGKNDAARHSLQCIVADYMALRWKVKDLKEQVIFFHHYFLLMVLAQQESE